MAEDATTESLDEFLGVKPQPAWRRHAKRGAIVVLVLALLLVRWFTASDQAQYSTAKVERGNLVTTVSATGKLAPTNQVTVGSQLSGLVVKVLVDVNDRVAAGQALAEIDPQTIEDQIRQGQAQLGRQPGAGRAGARHAGRGARAAGAAGGSPSPVERPRAFRARSCRLGAPTPPAPPPR
jgi:HlyD family secretion protein